MADLSMRSVVHETTRPSPPHFPSHVAARIEADWEGNRRSIPRIPGPHGPVDHAGDSDPSVDELLHRVRNPRSSLPTRRPGASLDVTAAQVRLETEAAWLMRDRQLADTVRCEIAAVAA
jgi:hypothetical protein